MELKKLSRRVGLGKKSKSSSAEEIRQKQRECSPLSGRTNGKKGVRRSVSFGAVSVREFERILDVKPACSEGPSIGIGWNYKPKEAVSLSKWEKKKTSRRNELLPLSQHKREKLAKKIGYSEEDIEKNIQRVERSKLIARKKERNDEDVDSEELMVRRISRAIEQKRLQEQAEPQVTECAC